MLSGGRGNNVEESQRGTLGIQKDRQKEKEEGDRDLESGEERKMGISEVSSWKRRRISLA